MFEGPISNNKEKNKYCPLAPWHAPEKRKYKSPISNNKKNKNVAPSPPKNSTYSSKNLVDFSYTESRWSKMVNYVVFT